MVKCCEIIQKSLKYSKPFVLQEKPYTCEYCNASYSERQYLMKHQSRDHGIEIKSQIHLQSLNCEFCGLKFSGKAELNLHQKCEHKQSSPNFCLEGKTVDIKCMQFNFLIIILIW